MNNPVKKSIDGNYKILWLAISVLFHLPWLLLLIYATPPPTVRGEEERLYVYDVRFADVSSSAPVFKNSEKSISKLRKPHKPWKTPNFNYPILKNSANYPPLTREKKTAPPDTETSPARPIVNSRQITVFLTPRIHKHLYPTKEPSRLNLYHPPETAATGDINISSINRKNDLLRYRNSIKEWINAQKIYPRSARIRGLEGVVRVSFSISESGRLIDSELVSSSHHETLDTAAVEAINNADPFPPFPDSIKENELRLNIVLSYRLNR